MAPLEDEAASYPLHVHSGILQIPRPFRYPQPLPIPPPPPPASWSAIDQSPIGKRHFFLGNIVLFVFCSRIGQDRSMTSVLKTTPAPDVSLQTDLLVKPQSNDTFITAQNSVTKVANVSDNYSLVIYSGLLGCSCSSASDFAADLSFSL